MRCTRGPFVVLVSLCLSAGARAGVVVAQPGGAFGTLQQAVNAAQDGDVVLVKGTWNAQNQAVLIEGKGLVLVGDVGSKVHVGQVAVRNLPAGHSVLLRTLDITGLWNEDMEGGLHLYQDAGSVRVEDCTIKGIGGTTGTWDPTLVLSEDAGPGVSIAYCADVDLHDCTITGGLGASLDDDDFQLNTSAGGDGLEARASVVTLHGCTLTGGNGGSGNDGGEDGSVGGYGVENKTAALTLESCTIVGGNGGKGDCSVSGCGFDAGGVVALLSSFPTATTTLRDSTLVVGRGPGISPPAWPGWLITAGTISIFHAPADSLEITSPVRDDESTVVSVTGEPGDELFGWVGLQPGMLPKGALQGSLLLGVPVLLAHLPLGALDGSGALALPIGLADMGPGVDSLTVWLQLVIGRDGLYTLGPVASLTVLDSSF